MEQDTYTQRAPIEIITLAVDLCNLQVSFQNPREFTKADWLATIKKCCEDALVPQMDSCFQRAEIRSKPDTNYVFVKQPLDASRPYDHPQVRKLSSYKKAMQNMRVTFACGALVKVSTAHIA